MTDMNSNDKAQITYKTIIMVDGFLNSPWSRWSKYLCEKIFGNWTHHWDAWESYSKDNRNATIDFLRYLREEDATRLITYITDYCEDASKQATRQSVFSLAKECNTSVERVCDMCNVNLND